MAKRSSGERVKVIGDVELRFDSKGRLDEVVLTKNGECVFHLEYLEGGFIYLGVDDVQIWLKSANTIRAFLE
jgi:hypothetical protein